VSSLPRAVIRVMSRVRLASCSRVGARPDVDGVPHIVCQGELIVGDDFELRSRPVQSHLVVGHGARLRIGNGVRIAAGAAISCQCRIDIEDGASLGAFCMIMDSDFHIAGDSEVAPEPKAIYIGRGARLGHRVVVLPGSRIGAGAVVASGSVVSGDVPAGTAVEGNPARIRLAPGADVAENTGNAVSELVQAVLGLAEAPALDDGPNQIPAWDSLGALRLVLALEERFEITLTEDEIRSAHSIRDIQHAVGAAERRRASVDQ
jgi:acetyltransferase-like isoleucine patch superfamily enzyme/acyl carrier protein